MKYDKQKAKREKKKHEDMAKVIAGNAKKAVEQNTLCKEC